MDFITKSFNIFIVVSILIIYPLTLAQLNCTKPPINKIQSAVIIDSIWEVRPRGTDVSQVYHIYYGKTVDGKTFSSRNKINLGDTLKFIILK